MKLTVKQIDSSKPKEKDYKLSDGGGLYLLVKTNGGKYWRLATGQFCPLDINLTMQMSALINYS